ncbi:hypothetical protein GCM10008919_01590 [Selenomonas dianae]|uniref:MurNAc-LAA domain-containing protein n=1 Tax=Selenomonas dianae TaxID=135079 RepID=A0ABP3CFP6_9FIRM
MRECDVAKNVTDLLAGYLTAAGVEVVGSLQSDSLHEVVSASNSADTDVFISIHCNACNGSANGTEVWHYYGSGEGEKLAQCIQNQIVDALGTVDRGIKSAKHGVNGLYVLSNTDAVAALVELAFIDHASDAELLRSQQDEFARAIARGGTDYEGAC